MRVVRTHVVSQRSCPCGGERPGPRNARQAAETGSAAAGLVPTPHLPPAERGGAAVHDAAGG
ncbi:hypothetical protein GCM10027174_17730 [Salinifilum aidingensis]